MEFNSDNLGTEENQETNKQDDSSLTKKRGRKPKKGHYFDETVEQAVIDYINTKEISERNKIYEQKLHKPITKLVEGIAKKYSINKHIGVTGFEEVIAQMYVQVYYSIDGFKYDIIGKSGQRVKAYSYLGTIAHNYLKNHSKKQYQLESKNDDIQQYNTSYLDEQIKEEHYTTPDPDENNEEQDNILFIKTIEALKNEVKNNKTLKDIDIKVANAIIIILENHVHFFNENNDDKIEYTKRGKIKKTKYTNIHTKYKIFYILKDITDLDTKEIRKSMNKLKSIYFLNKKELIEKENI